LVYQLDELPTQTMDAETRQSIIDGLANQRSGDLEAFFFSHGLGEAFSRPGRGWGRRKRIVEALKESERKGNLRELLEAAVIHFELIIPLVEPKPQHMTEMRRTGSSGLTGNAELVLMSIDSLASSTPVSGGFDRSQIQAVASVPGDDLAFALEELKAGGFIDGIEVAEEVGPIVGIRLTSAGRSLIATPKSVKTRDDERSVDLSRRVFIVHGREHALKDAVARLVRELGYVPVILHERPGRGRTLIEKFEAESEDAAFAVVLLTPDDVGGLRSENLEHRKFSSRARQNVVFEFGYFVGKLGRDRVTALVTSSEVEIPTDLAGLLYVEVASIEDADWRLSLSREMKAAGLDIDVRALGL
jgi:predicted nucleotide-binding protein